jgi:MFS family permease
MRSARQPVSFGWYVVAASFVILFLNSGARSMIGVLVKPVIADFGWSRGAYSAAVLVNMAVFAASLLAAGRLYDRYGPRWVVLGSSGLFSGGLVLMAAMTSLWQFFLFYGVIAAAGLGGLSAPIFGAIVSRWFRRRRGTAISLAMAGTSLGQFALVPLFTLLLLDQGWRDMLLWVGVLCLAVNAVLVLLVLRDHSRDAAGEPARSVPPPAEAPRAADGRPAPRSLSLREAARTGSFWLFATAMFVCGAGDFLLMTHLVPMATDHGESTSTAVAMLAWFGLLSLGGILVAGPLSDRVGDKVPIAATFALRVALFLLVVWEQNAATLWILALGFGFTFLVTAPLTTTLIGRLYGFASIGLLTGFITTVHHLGGGLWAYLGGAVFDATGDYTLAMAVSAAASAVALVCTLLIREVRHVAPGDEALEEPGAHGAA